MIPLGLILGRVLWNLFADRLGVADDPLTPAVAIALATRPRCSLPRSWLPSPVRLARRTPAAQVLRSP